MEGSFGANTNVSLAASPATTTSALGGTFTPLSSSVTTSAGLTFGSAASTSAPSFGSSLGSTTTSFSLPASSTSGFGVLNSNFGTQQTTTTASTFGLGTFSTPAVSTSTTGALNPTAGMSFGVPQTSASSGFGFVKPSTSAPTGFTLSSASTTTSAGFSLGNAKTSVSTGLTLGTSSTPSSTGFNLNAPATSVSTGFNLGSSTTSASTGFNLGTSSTSSGFNLGIPSTSTTTGFNLDKTSNQGFNTSVTTSIPSSSVTTAAATSVTSSVKPLSTSPKINNNILPKVNFAQLEENINKWIIELEEQEKVFMNQVAHINEWDRLLLSNGDKIISLNNSVEKVKLEQQQLDHELDFIVAQQRELEECLLPLEKEFADMTVSDPERDATYKLAENLNTQLRHMSEDLKEIIEDINEKNKNHDTSDPIVQIGRILNAHMNSLQWVDQNTTLIKQQLDQITKLAEIHRRENDSTQNL